MKTLLRSLTSMSTDYYAILNSRSLPQSEQIAECLRADGVLIEIDPIDWKDKEGAASARISGLRAELEWSIDPFEDEDRAAFGDVEGADVLVRFKTRASIFQIAASFAVLTAIDALVDDVVLVSDFAESPDDRLSSEQMAGEAGLLLTQCHVLAHTLAREPGTEISMDAPELLTWETQESRQQVLRQMEESFGLTISPDSYSISAASHARLADFEIL